MAIVHGDDQGRRKHTENEGYIIHVSLEGLGNAVGNFLTFLITEAAI